MLGGLVAAGALAPNAHADTADADLTFLVMLKTQGIAYSSPAFAIRVGHAICADLGNGTTTTDEALRLWTLSDISAPYDAGWYVGAAMVAYCPAGAASNGEDA